MIPATDINYYDDDDVYYRAFIIIPMSTTVLTGPIIIDVTATDVAPQ
jgi:hypothetical protein